MFSLVIDGKHIRSEDTVKPLISDLDDIAKSDGFDTAIIKYRMDGVAWCGHREWGQQGHCAEMVCKNYIMKGSGD